MAYAALIIIFYIVAIPAGILFGQVEFFQANSSSLDLLVLADFEGDVADILKRIERAIQKWCVECCSIHGWEIPFPQLTVHKAE